MNRNKICKTHSITRSSPEALTDSVNKFIEKRLVNDVSKITWTNSLSMGESVFHAFIEHSSVALDK